MSTPTNLIKMREVMNLFSTFKSLNGVDTVVQDKVVTVPYQFDAKTTWNIAKNLNILKRHIQDFEDARAALALSFADRATSPEKEAQFVSGLEQILNEMVTVEGMLKLKLEGLRLDSNRIPPGNLASIADYIDES